MALVLWTVPLLLAISLGGSHGTNLYDWTSWQILALFGVAIVALVVFVVIEFRASEPIISPRLLSKRIFSISMIAMFLMSAGMFGAIGFLPTFVQAVMGQTATNSGVILTPMMLGFMFSSVIGGQLLSITGRYKFLALGGFAVAAVGMWFLSQMDIHTSNPELIRNMVITGLGIGVMMSLFTIVVQNAFPFRQLGEVTATLSFFRSMGSTFGIGILGSVLTNSFVTNLQATMPAPLRAIIPADQIYKYLGQANGGGASGLMSKLGPLGPQAAVLLASCRWTWPQLRDGLWRGPRDRPGGEGPGLRGDPLPAREFRCAGATARRPVATRPRLASPDPRRSPPTCHSDRRGHQPKVSASALALTLGAPS